MLISFTKYILIHINTYINIKDKERIFSDAKENTLSLVVSRYRNSLRNPDRCEGYNDAEINQFIEERETTRYISKRKPMSTQYTHKSTNNIIYKTLYTYIYV